MTDALKQPEALRLADELANGDFYQSHPSVVYGWCDEDPCSASAAELRRQHAEIDALRARAEAAEEANETNARLSSNYIELTCGGPLDPMSEAMRAGDGTLHGAIAYWQGQAEALRKDAARYRWLRAGSDNPSIGVSLGASDEYPAFEAVEWLTNDEADAAVDAAMENTK